MEKNPTGNSQKGKSSVQKLLLKKNFFKRIGDIVKWSLIILLVLTIGCFITNFFVPGIAKWIGLGAGIVLSFTDRSNYFYQE